MKVNEIKVQIIDTAFVDYKEITMKTNIFLSTNVKYSRVIYITSIVISYIQTIRCNVLS